jgi:hypothetical protein
MAAFPLHFSASSALAPRATVASTARITQFAASELVESVLRVRSALGEVVLFLWGVLAVGFSLLVTAGFFLPHM